MKKIISIVGPTAVGKTALSIEMARQLNAEIISGDSMQVYKELDIGTAKITPAEMDGIRHHLIDILDINERFSVADFEQQARLAIDEIENKGKLPLVVGGTGFYLQSLVEKLSFGADHYTADSKKIRQELTKYGETNGKEALWEQLNKVDPDSAKKIDQHNSVRVIRALEVFELTGQRFSTQTVQQSDLDVLLIGLTTDRKTLYQRINQRVDVMMADGLEEEARHLYEQNGRILPAGKGIGYHELFDYFDGIVTRDVAIETIKKDSRHYAKRQLTWFNNKMDVHWFDLVSQKSTTKEIIEFCADWLRI
ncbi:tRNA (adenosine(37)-N6)-dimethylallyltransferase MiaA [Paucilactobacillus sp. N302-9]